MITTTNYTFDGKKILDFIQDIENFDPYGLYEINHNNVKKSSLNQPTGNFFYDPWEIKPEYKDTVIEECLDCLPEDIGEARIVMLQAGVAYYKHADIDDRYHLNLSGKNSFLVNVEKEKMYRMNLNNTFQTLDASVIHSAVNFGPDDRLQLVVRKRLTNTQLLNPKKIHIGLSGKNGSARYDFDNTFSPYLNRWNKQGVINDFSTDNKMWVSFNIEQEYTNTLCNLATCCETKFEITIYD
jgi:hypothetical protein